MTDRPTLAPSWLEDALQTRLTPRAWQAGWTLAVLALAALALLFASAPPAEGVTAGLLLLAAPGLLAFAPRAAGEGLAGVAGWTLLTAAALGLGGGVTGVLAAGVFAPLLAGVVLGRPLAGLGGGCLAAAIASIGQAAAPSAGSVASAADGAALASGLLAVTAAAGAAALTLHTRAAVRAGVPAATVDIAARLADAEMARDRAEAEARARARFIAEVSHELRTPLNAIMGFSDIMRQRMFGDLSDRYGEYADMIHQSGEHLTSLINDVLDLSKVDADRYELRREVFDAREPVASALKLMRDTADAKGVRLLGALPARPLAVDADARALKQIALNLVSNAVKFTPPGGEVTVSLLRANRDLELTVADTGVGVAPQELAELGRPYAQGQAGRAATGTGLGLALVKALAALHGGFLMIESQIGEGTAVTVRLPVLADEEAPAPSAEPPQVEPSPAGRLAGG